MASGVGGCQQILLSCLEKLPWEKPSGMMGHHQFSGLLSQGSPLSPVDLTRGQAGETVSEGFVLETEPLSELHTRDEGIMTSISVSPSQQAINLVPAHISCLEPVALVTRDTLNPGPAAGGGWKCANHP